MNKTKIEYADFSWNPIKMLCTPVSAGCVNCWHRRFANRHVANPIFGTRARAAEEIYAPMRRRQPSKITVQFMGDLFHELVTDKQICDVWHVIQTTRKNTFFLLTKRPERMYDMLKDLPGGLPHIWLGVSVENQEAADERIPLLLQTPAAHRWVSIEPMLGPINITRKEAKPWGPDGASCWWTAKLDWVVCGAETGPHKRPCKAEWIDSLRSQCASAGVKFFGKVDSKGKPIMPREMP